MADDQKGPALNLKVGGRLRTNFQKSPQYRTIHCDGAFGGITPRGYISFTLYNERNVIPRLTSREVLGLPEGGSIELGPDEIEESLEGIMRQLEATVVMDMNTAREFHTWFSDKLANLEQAMGLPEDQRLGQKKDVQA